MSDEEKKAIAEVKDVIEYDKEHRIVTIYDKQPLFRDTLQTLLNLIEKKQKEIEELNLKNEKLYEDNLTLAQEIKELEKENWVMRCVDKQYIAKDKIKAKIEEIDIEIQCCEYADDDIEEYKQDMEKEKRRLLRDKTVLESLLEKE